MRPIVKKEILYRNPETLISLFIHNYYWYNKKKPQNYNVMRKNATQIFLGIQICIVIFDSQEAMVNVYSTVSF